MGKQKLTAERVELIKYLLDKKAGSHNTIATMFDMSRAAITNINRRARWSEVNTPSSVRGEYLFYKLLNGELR